MVDEVEPENIGKNNESKSDEKKKSEKEEYFDALFIWYTNYVNHVQQINAATASFYCHLATQFQAPTINGTVSINVRPVRAIGSLFGPVRAQRQDEVIPVILNTSNVLELTLLLLL